MLLPISAFSTSTPTLSIHKQSETTFTVDISEVADFAGYDIKITWDPAVVSLQQATDTPPWSAYFVVRDNITEGSYRLAILELGSPGFTGSATLFTLNFTVLTVADTWINFTKTDLADSQANRITPQLEPYYHTVDVGDLRAGAYYFDTANSRYDLNHDGTVDALDLRSIAAQIN